MIEVIPLKYGAAFKQVFSQPEVFTRFAQDVLGIKLNIDTVHTEYEYPEPIGFVRSRYDLFAEDEEQRIIVEIQHVKEEDFFDRFLYYHLISMAEQVRGFDEYGFDRTVFTIVVLTSVPRDGSVNFSCAVSDFSPIDEQGKKVPVYPHRLVFLSPPQASEHTPPLIRRWLDFIADSLDGKMEESSCTDAMFREMAEAMRRHTVDPAVLAEIKDEAAWNKAKERFLSEGRRSGLEEGIERGALAQQRKTVLQAHQMGINPVEISALVGLSEAEVQDIISGSEK
ncbi:MAG: hypothetical protein D3921_10435 [Candidatus Electrothrix sp. AW1]|nr:hypothetical protein [Candidatus Electrothrix sp. AX1]MCI5182908.1 hypothetical protein [Candidatus Electrothrix gigas]